MDYHQIFAIGAAGLQFERTRVDVAALNLANANTVATADGRGYQPLRVIAHAQPFATQFEWLISKPQPSVEATNTAPQRVYDPHHPFADNQGFVAYPGVDTATEMMTMIDASRAYEANLFAINIARNLVLKTLNIGGAE